MQKKLLWKSVSLHDLAFYYFTVCVLHHWNVVYSSKEKKNNSYSLIQLSFKNILVRKIYILILHRVPMKIVENKFLLKRKWKLRSSLIFLFFGSLSYRIQFNIFFEKNSSEKYARILLSTKGKNRKIFPFLKLFTEII